MEFLTETEVKKMVGELQRMEDQLNDGIDKRKAKIEEDKEFAPIYKQEIRLLRRSLIGIQTALLNLEAWLYSKI